MHRGRVKVPLDGGVVGLQAGKGTTSGVTGDGGGIIVGVYSGGGDPPNPPQDAPREPPMSPYSRYCYL